MNDEPTTTHPREQSGPDPSDARQTTLWALAERLRREASYKRELAARLERRAAARRREAER